MAKQFPNLDAALRDFIERQKIFFTGSATDNSRVNISPRSTDLLRIVDDNSILYLDRVGSGNETAAHMLADGRMTIMFCALEGPPRILRLYGKGRTISRGSVEYEAIIAEHFSGEDPHGARQVVKLDFDLVQTSCGFGVPLYEYQGDRDSLERWAADKSPEELADYQRQKNRTSLDGLPTGMLEET